MRNNIGRLLVMSTILKSKELAYIVGVALGDGNLSNPNGRAVRLRITCDKKYPELIAHIKVVIQQLLSNNRVSLVDRGPNYLDISCYSNKWEKWLGWSVGKGSKIEQNVRVPAWIRKNKTFSLSCVRGLFETDGSVYIDRGYLMVNFTSVIPGLAKDVAQILADHRIKAHTYIIDHPSKRTKYVIRISKDVQSFLIKTGILKK